jgi:ferredoxin/flavodoxin---NADP+ reductase
MQQDGRQSAKLQFQNAMQYPSDNLNPVVDLAIIGAGPVGLFASFYAGLRQMSVKVIDSLDVLGGQLVTLYPEKYIYDVAGFPRILAKDLAKNLIEQGMQYGAVACLGEQVRTLEGDDAGGFVLRTSKAAHRARAILIAAGVGSFRPRRLPLREADRFEGRGLHYFVKEPGLFKDRRVLIVGGGDSAVDWANLLAPLTAELTLIHRRDQFRAHEDSVARMHRAPARILLFHELKSIIGDGRVERAVVFDNRTKEERSLEVDRIIVNIGFESSLGPIAGWGLQTEGGQIKVDAMMQTSRRGVFAAGDIATFTGKLKLIATGFGEACIAVNFAKHYLDPSANIFPGHSSNLKP